MSKRVGVLTGGGDAPGLNAVIRAVARRSQARGYEVIGVREGWAGLVHGRLQPLGPREISGILPRGGTIIGTTRTNPFKVDGGVDAVLATFADNLDALVAIGGEDTLGVAARLYEEHDFPVVGVPKTIDNDLSGTDYTFGFDTAVSICTEAIDRLHTTAESHNRVMVVEVMGRHTGWIAVMSGIAGGADVILIPEQPITVEAACREHQPPARARQGLLDRRRQRGLRADVRVGRAPHVTQDEGRRRVRPRPPRRRRPRARAARSRSAPATRRASPSSATCSAAARRRRATACSRRRYGLKAADLVHEEQFGQMAALHGDEIVAVSLREATAELKTVPPEWYDVAKAFFG